MNNQYEHILEEEVGKYAPYYYEQLKRSVLRGTADFRHHLIEVCKFDEDFYESIFYEGDYFTEKVNDYEYKLYKQSVPLDKVDEQRNAYQNELMQTLESDFLKRFLTYYDKEIKKELEQSQEELAHSKEDELYYINRFYVGEEKDIGGEVTEEDRLRYIEDERKRQMMLTEKITSLQEVKRGIKS